MQLGESFPDRPNFRNRINQWVRIICSDRFATTGEDVLERFVEYWEQAIESEDNDTLLGTSKETVERSLDVFVYTDLLIKS